MFESMLDVRVSPWYLARLGFLAYSAYSVSMGTFLVPEGGGCLDRQSMGARAYLLVSFAAPSDSRTGERLAHVLKLGFPGACSASTPLVRADRTISHPPYDRRELTCWLLPPLSSLSPVSLELPCIAARELFVRPSASALSPRPPLSLPQNSTNNDSAELPTSSPVA